jgi:hypothetical protein
MIENDILSVVLWLWATICLTSGLTLVILSFWREHHVDSRSDILHRSHFARVGILLGTSHGCGQTDAKSTDAKSTSSEAAG